MTEEDFDKFCERVEWHWAKTYAHKFPHWYCVRSEVGDKEFEEAVKFIREHKVVRLFFRTPYGYYDRGKFTYWTMGNPLEQTRIINRAIL